MQVAAIRIDSRWIPESAQLIDLDGGVVYAYTTRAGMPAAVFYTGSAGKPSAHHSYSKPERRDEAIARYVEALADMKKRKAERLSARFKPHTLKIGDIVVNSWGWEQTNIDFYEVVKTTANYVWLEEIGATSCGNGMADHCRPDPTHRSSKISKHAADAHGYVCFKHGLGSKDDGSKHYRSWYA